MRRTSPSTTVPRAHWAGSPARFPPRSRRSTRYRSHGEPAITVQNVSVGDGGKAIVGNVTQHASVIVAEKENASAARKAAKAARRKRRRERADARREAAMTEAVA